MRMRKYIKRFSHRQNDTIRYLDFIQLFPYYKLTIELNTILSWLSVFDVWANVCVICRNCVRSIAAAAAVAMHTQFVVCGGDGCGNSNLHIFLSFVARKCQHTNDSKRANEPAHVTLHAHTALCATKIGWIWLPKSKRNYEGEQTCQ